MGTASLVGPRQSKPYKGLFLLNAKSWTVTMICMHSVAQEIAKSKGDDTIGRSVVFVVSLLSIIMRLKV